MASADDDDYVPEPRVLRPLRETNPHLLDGCVVLIEPGHKYMVRASLQSDWDAEPNLSCTTVVHEFFPSFDSHAVSTRSALRQLGRSISHPSRIDQEVATLAEGLRRNWEANSKAASDAGTRMHKLIEDFYNSPDREKEYVSHPDLPEMQLFAKFHRDHVLRGPMRPWRAELAVSSREWCVCGTIDMIYVTQVSADKSGPVHLKVVIVDWKRSKDLQRVGYGGAMGTGPCVDLPASNFGHYSLQLAIYKYILETDYGKGCSYHGLPIDTLTVTDMFLCVCHPSQPSYQLVRPQYVTTNTVRAVLGTCPVRERPT